MNNFNYKHIQAWERNKLSNLVGDEPTLSPIYGMTQHGWDIIKFKFLVDVPYLALKMGRDRKTIKNELIRGKYWTTSKDVSKQTSTFSYSTGASEYHHQKIIASRKKSQLKINQDEQLKKFVKDNIGKQSLAAIAGRTKVEVEKGNLKSTITGKTLYNYIDNDAVDFISEKNLIRKQKRKYRMKRPGKRQNGVSIDERPDEINKRLTFGHWEMDLIIGMKNTMYNLLTLYERKTRFGIAMKIKGKSKEEINKALRMLQENGTLEYGRNIKSVTVDNGSEFFDWMKYKKSIINPRDDIDVYFCHPFSSWEKGGVENFNEMIRQYFPTGTDFSKYEQKDINIVADILNNKYRRILGYLSANEVYNKFNQI